VDTTQQVQIAIKKFPDGRVEEKNILINPTIPLEASETATDDMVKDAQPCTSI
jgi:hypothetical protein